MQASEVLRQHNQGQSRGTSESTATNPAMPLEVDRLQAVVAVKDACIKNYTNFIKHIQALIATSPHAHELEYLRDGKPICIAKHV